MTDLTEKVRKTFIIAEYSFRDHRSKSDDLIINFVKLLSANSCFVFIDLGKERSSPRKDRLPNRFGRFRFGIH